MPAYNWDDIVAAWLPPESRRPGATLVQIEAAERRLGVALPPSYRSFLQVTNGCKTGGDFVWELWPAEEIGWFAKLDPQWVHAYNAPWLPKAPTLSDREYFVYGRNQDPAYFRTEYLHSALKISPEGDSAVYLLNPKVVTPEGEWEAWFFANWLPGASRYRSFVEMVLDDYNLTP